MRPSFNHVNEVLPVFLMALLDSGVLDRQRDLRLAFHERNCRLPAWIEAYSKVRKVREGAGERLTYSTFE